MGDKGAWERKLPGNVGFAFDLEKGQRLRITAQNIIDFVAFNRANLRERFDQARTKSNKRKIFVSTGDLLISRFNNPMLTILEDTFKEGHHDLQEGMCSRKRYELAAQKGIWEITYNRPVSEMPTHGCTENLTGALASYDIPYEDIPSPFNLFQHMVIDGKSGLMEHSTVRPKEPAWVTMRAEMDLLAALSVCPDVPMGGSKGATLTVFEPA